MAIWRLALVKSLTPPGRGRQRCLSASVQTDSCIVWDNCPRGRFEAKEQVSAKGQGK